MSSKSDTTMLRTRTTIVILGVLTAAMLIYVGVTHPYYLAERGGGSLAKSRNLNSAAVMLVHSWYDETCCHGKDCHPVPCEEIEKISDGWLWRDVATKQRHWFPHDHLKASHDDASHVCVSPETRPSGICIYLPLPA